MLIKSQDRILIIAAHPDDEILGCGGFLSKYSNQVEISVVFIAEGDSCRFDNPELTPLILKINFHVEDSIKLLLLILIKLLKKRFCPLSLLLYLVIILMILIMIIG